jgi:hypothetical protein
MVYATVYEWPYSQICMDCAHKRPDILDNSAVICTRAETRNDGVTCPSFCDACIEPLLDEEVIET